MGTRARLVDESHRVGDVHVSAARGLRRGDVVSVRKGRANVSGRVRKLSFLGRVVRSSGHGAVVRLGDGSIFKLGGGKPHGHRARSAANVTIDFQGLAPGQTLLITIATDAQGNVAITIRVLSAPTDIGDGSCMRRASSPTTRATASSRSRPTTVAACASATRSSGSRRPTPPGATSSTSPSTGTAAA